MPRPTVTQLVYGSATVFLSTLAMLLLSQTETGIGVAVIALAGLGLGLLVAMTVPMPGVSRVVRRGGTASPGAPAPLHSVPGPDAGFAPPGTTPNRRTTGSRPGGHFH
ncbi:hypothetical protein ADL22_26375 [Streptomyces sp. NRRL F-4489]|uniref:hypothetical protein n=1 Tax=Streptomyces sp. NRRL F-4489 TaxID=1609095 RepID=UPI000749EC75|nr:hypothetical protein [Streptomyces sp. NRRL F-4489]KUL35733.1 hypothetical protein ADL22_26375 [Streptomyces sp. NRRL F-4489]